MTADSELRLVFTSIEGLSVALEYGKSRWGCDASGDSPTLSHAPDSFEKVLAGKLIPEIFEGVISEIEDVDEDAYVTLTSVEGKVREFDVVGKRSAYAVGRPATVRYVTEARTPAGHPLISVLEFWVGS